MKNFQSKKLVENGTLKLCSKKDSKDIEKAQGDHQEKKYKTLISVRDPRTADGICPPLPSHEIDDMLNISVQHRLKEPYSHQHRCNIK